MSTMRPNCSASWSSTSAGAGAGRRPTSPAVSSLCARRLRRRLDARRGAHAVADRGDRERPRAIITRNESPDISFDRSINPYRGCEHGCFYCFARPTHAYLGLFARAGFREPAVRQAGRGQTARARTRPPNIGRNRSRSAPIPTPISRSNASTASRADPRNAAEGAPSGRNRHQVGPRPARSRPLAPMASEGLVKVSCR